MTTEPRTTNYKPPLVLPSVRIVFTCCGASLLRNTVCSSFRPPAALRLEYPPHQLKPAAPGIHRPPLGLSAFLPPSSLTLHPWPITHHSSPPTFYPLPLIIKLAAAVAFWIYYSQHIAYPACPSQARSLSAQKESIMQNKPNLPRFCAKNGYLEEKQTQFKPNQTQFFPPFFLPILPIHPISTPQSFFLAHNLTLPPKSANLCPFLLKFYKFLLRILPFACNISIFSNIITGPMVLQLFSTEKLLKSHLFWPIMGFEGIFLCSVLVARWTINKRGLTEPGEY